VLVSGNSSSRFFPMVVISCWASFRETPGARRPMAVTQWAPLSPPSSGVMPKGFQASTSAPG
jgi:hypothetical protein